MRYRFLLFIPLLAALTSCQPVNRDKSTPAVALDKQQLPATDTQPDAVQQPTSNR
jgi:hypothetical protein